MLRVIASAAVGIACAAARPAWGAPLPISGIACVGLRVSNLERALGYWSGVLGFPVVASEHAANGHDVAWLRVGSAQRLRLESGWRPEDKARLAFIAFATPSAAAPPTATDAQVQPALRAVANPCGPGLGPARGAHDPLGHVIVFTEPEPRAPSQARLDAAAPVSRHLQHVGIDVPAEQLEATARFYLMWLGGHEVWRHPSHGTSRLIKIALPGSRADVIELMAVEHDPNRFTLGAVHHVNFAVTDIQAAFRLLVSNGASKTGGFRPQINAEHLWAIDLFDPDGIRTEIQDLRPVTLGAPAR